MAVLYGRAGRITAQNGGFRRGQMDAVACRGIAVEWIIEMRRQWSATLVTMDFCMQVIIPLRGSPKSCAALWKLVLSREGDFSELAMLHEIINSVLMQVESSMPISRCL